MIIQLAMKKKEYIKLQKQFTEKNIIITFKIIFVTQLNFQNQISF